MDTPVDFGPLARRVGEVVTGTADAQLDDPTPCPDYSVRALLGHLVGLTAAFRDAARKNFSSLTDTDPGAGTPEPPTDWRTQFPLMLDELAATWRDPAAWTGMTRAGGIDLPGDVAGRVVIDELLIHGWDLAVATGQSYDADPELLNLALEFLNASTDPSDREGMFGPVVPAPADATELDRAVALSGRDPAWTP
ncbi:TIGR03086 family protein [Streptomyces sp. P38-E01]|uniref:TIGR03086 family protein n=1 Tax=Streptomyces tardus TaxID=2780544 RepID=A0A949JDT2_9ACTN|nr:TIGR03086 family metal-binding protein [Streptomyces tardus]MBU7597148.1 TIGR03086 family protein [Streptomyces tardus]